MLKKLILAVLLVAAHIYADNISLGIPNYNGSGCPTGTVNTVLNPDSSQLSILFDAFTVEASGSNVFDRKGCNLNIPVHVPTGISIALVKMDYRGFTSVPEGASADLDVDSFFVGVRNNGPRHHCGFKKKPRGDFYLSNQLTSTNLVWSPCGKDINLRVLSSISARTNSKGEQTLAALDSLDVSAGLTYQIQWQTCTEPPPPVVTPTPRPPGPMPPPFPPGPHGPGPGPRPPGPHGPHGPGPRPPGGPFPR